jgi:hypothetical protein
MDQIASIQRRIANLVVALTGCTRRRSPLIGLMTTFISSSREAIGAIIAEYPAAIGATNEKAVATAEQISPTAKDEMVEFVEEIQGTNREQVRLLGETLIEIIDTLEFVSAPLPFAIVFTDLVYAVLGAAMH